MFIVCALEQSPVYWNFCDPIKANVLSYSTIVLYIGIKKVWGFLPKNSIKKSAKYLLSDSMAALVKHGSIG